MSHKLCKIKITNFKSIKDETFELSDYTPLIGYNNAGKTNILYAIKWLLNKGSLGEGSFNNIREPLQVEGVIEGITEEILNSLEPTHKASIESYIQNSELHIKRVQNEPNESATRIKLHIKRANSDEWTLNPTGIDNAIACLFPDPIHIGAMENAEEDASKSSKNSTIGKLLAEIIGPIENQYGAQVGEKLDSLKKMLDADGEERAPELNSFDEEVNQKIDSFFPGVNIKLHVPTPELKEFFNKGTIKVYEQDSLIGRDLSSLGHGAQRSIQMALIRHLAELKRENSNTNTLLLIDEPELYLHPQAIELVRDSLKLLSQQGYQIIFSTHSALMVTHEDIANAVLIRKNPTRGTHCRKTLKSSIIEIESNAQSQLLLLFSLSNSSNILFSEKIILTEGKTEERILPKIIEKITGKSLGAQKLALVKLGGSGSTKKSLKVLGVMDIPSKAIVDFDYIFKNAVNDGFLQPDDIDLVACKELMLMLSQTNNIILDGNGCPQRGGSMSASEAFELLASQPQILENIESIHSKLRTNNIWVWKGGAIEKHLGIEGKSESVWATFANRIKNEPVTSVISDYQEISNCIDWLNS